MTDAELGEMRFRLGWFRFNEHAREGSDIDADNV